MSGIKYLNFVADIFGVSSEERQDRIRKYAGVFELTKDLAQPISSYSHGMKQKLAVISAWIHSPRLIIMDEPFVGLDPKAAFKLHHGRAFCRSRSESRVQAQRDDARALRQRRRDIFFDPCAGGRRKALRQGRHYQAGQADQIRYDGRGQRQIRHDGRGQRRREPRGSLSGTGGGVNAESAVEKTDDGGFPRLFLQPQNQQGAERLTKSFCLVSSRF